ncbi:hypothetical protein Tco_0759860 [Tanacetum coccineum]
MLAEDAKFLWESYKNSLEATRNQRRCRRPFLKQNYRNFTASSPKKDRKNLERFQKLLSQLEFPMVYESLDQRANKFKLKFPSNGGLVSSNKPAISTNETVNTVYNVSAASFKDQDSTASYAHDVMVSFFANQSNAPQLDNEDLEQIDACGSMKKVDLKLQVQCLPISHFARECRAPKNQGNRNRDDPRRNAPVDTSTTNALVVQDG